MLIIVPPSETKRPAPDVGRSVRLHDLSFPVLTDLRMRILEALIETSARPDAFQRLYVGPSKAGDVARNIRLRQIPTLPALDVYSGPLHEGLDAATFTPSVADRAQRDLVVASSLWGVLRPSDRIPPYRLHICAHLVGVDGLERTWRTAVGAVLEDAGRAASVVMDVRSPTYQAMGMPGGESHRIVTVRVATAGGDGRRIGDVVAKRIRGQAVRLVLDSGADPEHPAGLAEILAERWPVRLDDPPRPGRAWTLTLTADGVP